MSDLANDSYKTALSQMLPLKLSTMLKYLVKFPVKTQQNVAIKTLIKRTFKAAVSVFIRSTLSGIDKILAFFNSGENGPGVCNIRIFVSSGLYGPGCGGCSPGLLLGVKTQQPPSLPC